MAAKIRLIVVDDEVRFLRTLTQRLSLRDFDVTSATSGQEAVQKARSQQFDLALVDLKMPGMTGEELLQVLKKEHPFIEVVILTGHGSIESAVQCTSAGSYNYLQKPCETNELMEVLKNAFQSRRIGLHHQGRLGGRTPGGYPQGGEQGDLRQQLHHGEDDRSNRPARGGGPRVGPLGSRDAGAAPPRPGGIHPRGLPDPQPEHQHRGDLPQPDPGEAQPAQQLGHHTLRYSSEPDRPGLDLTIIVS